LIIIMLISLFSCSDESFKTPTDEPAAPVPTNEPTAPAPTLQAEPQDKADEPATPAQTEFDDGTYVIAMYSDFTDWDPATAFSLEIWYLYNVYEPLLWYNPPGSAEQFTPALATSWESADEGMTWTFYLREGVTFHDGTPFNADAVKYSIERIMEMGGGAAWIWGAVEEIEIVDDYTVVFHLGYAAPLDLIASSQYQAYIMSPTSADKGTEWFMEGNDAGTGPYMVASWEPEQQTVLVKYDDYWGGWKGHHFSQVILKLALEQSTQVQMLESGEADRATLVPYDSIDSLEANPDISVNIVPSWMNAQFLINTQKPPTDNLLVRQALCYAWDYDTVVNDIYNGMASVAEGIIPKTMWGHNDHLNLYEFDLEKAQALLEEAGYGPGDLKLDLAYLSTSAEYENAALLLQENLAKIDVELELKPGEWTTIWENAKNLETAPNLQSMTWWPTYPTPNDWIYGLFRTEDPTFFNLSHYSNPEMDDLLDRAMIMEAIGRNVAIEMYGQIQQMLLDEAAAIFYADLSLRVTRRADIVGAVTNPAYGAEYFYNLSRQ
jgi:peptide/nickel transport system substrate-binding protein